MAYQTLQVFQQLHPRRAPTTAALRRPSVLVVGGLVLVASLITALANVLPAFGQAAAAARLGSAMTTEPFASESPLAPALMPQPPAESADADPLASAPPAPRANLAVALPGLSAAPPSSLAAPPSDVPPAASDLTPDVLPPSPPPGDRPPDTSPMATAEPPPVESPRAGTETAALTAEVGRGPEPPAPSTEQPVSSTEHPGSSARPAEFSAQPAEPGANPPIAPPESQLLLDVPARPGQPVRVPILMYHHIGGLPAQPDQLRLNLTLSVADFAAHLAYFRDQGYQTVTLNEVVAAMYGAGELPDRPIVLTFDDGYLDHYTNAFPLLQEYGFTGTFFIVTSLVGDGEYVTWDQLREMAAAGMRIEAHGLTHRDLRELGSAGIWHEVTQARQTLEEEIGQPVRFYCYPAGKYTGGTPDLLAEAGYLGAVTVQPGLTASPAARYELPRVRIHRGDSPWAVAARIE